MYGNKRAGMLKAVTRTLRSTFMTTEFDSRIVREAASKTHTSTLLGSNHWSEWHMKCVVRVFSVCNFIRLLFHASTDGRTHWLLWVFVGVSFACFVGGVGRQFQCARYASNQSSVGREIPDWKYARVDVVVAAARSQSMQCMIRMVARIQRHSYVGALPCLLIALAHAHIHTGMLTRSHIHWNITRLKGKWEFQVDRLVQA